MEIAKAQAPRTIETDATKAIPDKDYFTIGEVSELCGVKQHVLRYWEQEFKQLQPKRRGNRRYYRYEDVLLVRRIATLLHKKGFTIKGAKEALREQHKTPTTDEQQQEISGLIQELEVAIDLLKAENQ